MKALVISLKIGEHSGANTLSRAVIDHLVLQGVDVSVCAEAVGEFPFQISRLEPISGVGAGSAFLRNVLKVRAAAKNVDVVHAMDGWPYAVYGWFAVLGTRKRLFISGVGTYSVAPFYAKSQRWLIRRAFDRAMKVFCISDYTKKELAKAGVPEKKLTTVLMGTSPLPDVSADEKTAFQKKYGIEEGRHPIILTVGAIKVRKGQLQTLKAVEILKVKYPNILYVAVGSARGEYTEELRQYIVDHHLEKNCLIVSDADERALSYFYATCDVVALNSYSNDVEHSFEGFGLVIVEGYKYGKPAVGSRDCGIESAIFDQETGLLTEQNQPKDIAEKLQSVLANYETFSANAKKRYADFSWDKTTNSYQSYYKASNVGIFQTARYELLDQIKRHAHYVKGRVLDVGAGPRSRYRQLFTCGEYVRMDIAGVDNIDVIGTAESIPLPDNSFDTVVSTQVFGDVPNVPKAFAECYRVLKPGGRFFLTLGFVDPLNDDPADLWRFTSQGVRQLAEEAKFSIEVLEARGGYHSVMAQLHLRYLISNWNMYESRWAKAFGLYAKIKGHLALFRDRHDRSPGARRITHGYLLVAKK